MNLIEKVNLARRIFKPEGNAKIELFKSGKLVETQEKNNFVSIGVLNALARIKILDIFIEPMSTTIKGGYSSDDSLDRAYGDNFSRMILTSADHPEDPENEWLPKGTLIGEAETGRTYSGSDPLIGTLNETESFVNPRQLHLVFDFATDKANGTFQSIYFMPITAYNSNASHYTTVFPEVSGVGESGMHATKVGTEYYVFSNGMLYIYNESFELKEEVSSYSYYANRDMHVHNGYVYYANSENSRGITRAPLSDPSNYEVVITGVFYGITRNPETGRWYTATPSEDENGDAVISILEYDSSFQVLGEVMRVKWSNRYNIDPGLLNYHDGEFIYADAYLSGRSYYKFGQNVIGVIGDKVVLSNGSLREKIFIGSRVRLADPVTKTEEYTMKVTYDFHLN